MALSTMGRYSDTLQKMTTENGDRVVSHSSFHLKDFVPPFHVSVTHCVLCGFDCDEYWVVKEKKWLEMNPEQSQDRQ